MKQQEEEEKRNKKIKQTLFTQVKNMSTRYTTTPSARVTSAEESGQKLDRFSQNEIIFAFNFTAYYLL